MTNRVIFTLILLAQSIVGTVFAETQSPTLSQPPSDWQPFYLAANNLSSSDHKKVFHADIEKLKSFVDRAEFNDAFEYAKSIEDSYIGDTRFDFYFGLAAINTGHSQIASFAFERILLEKPNAPRVQLELARAYFYLKNFESSKKLFEQVLALKPPAQVEQKLRTFLSAIEQQQNEQDIHFSTSVGVSVGFDDNANSATSAGEFDFLFGPLTVSASLEPESQKQSDQFIEADITLNINKPINQQDSQYLTLSYEKRANESSTDFDTDTFGIGGGFVWERGSNRYRLPLSVQSLFVGNEDTRNTMSMGFDWTHALSSQANFLTFMQGSAIRYPELSEKNTDLGLAGVGFSYSFPILPLNVLTSFIVGDDHARQVSSNGKEFVGVRAGFQYQAAPKLFCLFSANVQRSVYHDQGIYVERRKDWLADTTLSMRWHVSRELYAKAELSYTDNHSNVAIFDYDRFQSLVGVNYTFE